MTFADRLTEDRRLVILRVLAETPAYSLNGSILHEVLERYGHRVSRDQVRTDLAWLAEQDLVEVEVIADQLHVATLRQRGLDVAQGRASVPGVRRPAPGS